MNGGAEAVLAAEALEAYERQAREARDRRREAAIAGARLSPLEVEILRWVSLGKSSLDICQLMGLGTEWTVEKRVSKIMGKTGTPNRSAAVSWALRNAVIE